MVDLLPLIERVQGRPGAGWHPWPPVRRSSAQMHRGNDHRRSRDIRPSLHNGLTAYAELSPETNSSCLRHLANWQRKPNSVGRLSPSQSLAPATGARTTRFCRTPQRRSSCAGTNRSQPKAALQSPSRATLSRPPHPHSTYRDDAYAPLHEAGGAKRTAISRNGKRIIFSDRTGPRKSRWTD
jgi:hypothetical protein